MIILPEMETVLIMPPRTGSTSLRDALLARHRKAMMLYRHMERPGIPLGYERYRTVCLVREPLDRLLSVYSYMGNFRTTANGVRAATAPWIEILRKEADRPFEEWLRFCTHTLVDPVQLDGSFIPHYNILEKLPIARKSLIHWARPDMGEVELVSVMDQPRKIEQMFDIKLPHLNASPRETAVERTPLVQAHLNRFFQWDQAVTADLKDMAPAKTVVATPEPEHLPV